MRFSHVKGVNRVMANMKKQNTAGAALKFQKGLKRAALFLQRKSQEIVPVDEGPLRASAFTRVRGKGWKTEARVGYTASYALYVHENLDALHGAAYNAEYAEEIASSKKRKKSGQFVKAGKRFRKKRPQEQAKFLEQPVRMHRRRMLKIIAGKV